MGTTIVHWRDAKGHLSEYEGAEDVRLVEGALVFLERDKVRLIVAPGDWHDVDFTYADEED